jgi:putative DNA primase/helicase
MRADLDLYQRGALIVRPGCVAVTVSTPDGPPCRSHPCGRGSCVGRTYDSGGTLAALRRSHRRLVEYRCSPQSRDNVSPACGLLAPSRPRRSDQRAHTRADGNILAMSCYDAATGLLLHLGNARFPSLPEHPTRTAAVSALALLDGLVATFPFVDRRSRPVALSAILTASIRRSLPAARLHGFTASSAGSGKSMLVDLASVIVTGGEASVIAQGQNEEELEKRLGALFLVGEHAIAIDNCEAPLSGEFLCAMLSQRTVRARNLGRSEAPELPTNAFVTVTGNNLVLVGDVTRRCVMCRLDSNMSVRNCDGSISTRSKR